MNNDLISRSALKEAFKIEELYWGKRIIDIIDNAPTIEPFEPDYVEAERLINEYISKVSCCDECFASVYCTVNGLRESRVPQDYCLKNIKRYFGDKANLTDSKEHEGGEKE